MSDLLAFERKDEEERRQGLAELSAEAQKARPRLLNVAFARAAPRADAVAHPHARPYAVYIWRRFHTTWERLPKSC
jgi:hypothetical protein